MADRLLTIEPSVGWRVWTCEMQCGSPRLRSIYYPEFWPYGVRAKARCGGGLVRHVPHDAPDEFCDCGIWATFDVGEALSYAPRWLRGRNLIRRRTTFVVGRVALTGRVDEYDRGYRGEYAYPVELHVPSMLEIDDDDRMLVLGAREVARRLGDLYEVPARVIQNAAQVAA